MSNGKNTLAYLPQGFQLSKLKQFKLPKIVLVILLLLFALTSISFCYERIYAQKVFPNVKIAGINVGGKNPEELKSFLEEKTKLWSEEQLVVAVADEIFKPKINELGISFQVQEQAKQAFSIARGTNWLKSQGELLYVIFIGKNQPLLIKIDEEKLNQFLAPFEARFEKPQNASLKIEGQTVSIVPAKEGVVLDKEDFMANLKNRVGYLSPEPITLLAKQAKPTINEGGVQEAKQKAEDIISKSLMLTYENKVFKVESSHIAAFVKFTEKGNNLEVDFSDEEIDKFIASLAKKIDIRPKDKQVMVDSGVVLDEGKDGRALDRESTKAQIKQGLATSSKTFELKVVEKKKGQKTIYPAGTPGLYEGKYIEIVLSKQTVYVFEGSTLVKSFLISSGLPKTPTPTGTFSIFSKSSSVLMAGPGYYLPGVKWVSRFYNGYSIHGTYWHNNFGQPMSHGCVNASNDNGAFIYNWAPMGTPVYIHR